MKLFGRSHGDTVEAIVTDAAPPPQSVLAPHYGDWVWVVTDLGEGPVSIRAVVPLPLDRWLLPGMKVSIRVRSDDLVKVSAFEVDFDQVPKIEDLVAANDPVVGDPRGARAAARSIRNGAATPVGAPTGLWSRLTSQAWIGENFAESASPRPHLDTDAWSADFDREVTAASSKPADPGKVRGVAILTALRMEMRSIAHNWDGTPELDRESLGPQRALRGINTVLTVTIPGQSPYAVFIEHFKPPRSKPVDLDPTVYPWLPVQVSLTDPNDVEVVWDEVPDRLEQIGTMLQDQVDARIDEVHQIQEAAGVPGAAASRDQDDEQADPPAG